MRTKDTELGANGEERKLKAQSQKLRAGCQRPRANGRAPGLIANCHLLIAPVPNKVVQHHRRARLHIAPEPEATTRTSCADLEDSPPVKPQLSWTTAKWAFLGAWLPLILANGIAVASSGIGGIRVSQTSGTRPGTPHRRAASSIPPKDSDSAESPVSAGNPNGLHLRRGGPVLAEQLTAQVSASSSAKQVASGNWPAVAPGNDIVGNKTKSG